MSKIKVCVKFTLVLIWTFVDKIKLQSRFSNMLVTLFSSFLQTSFRSDYSFLLSIDIAKRFIDWNVNSVTDHDWSWRTQIRCDRREEINAKAEDAKKKTKIEDICESCENENLVEDLVENLDLDRCGRYLQISMMKRSISQNKVKVETAERYRFRERMLFQTSRIWAFRVLIKRRVLIDCRLWDRKSLTTSKRLRERRAVLIE